MAMPSGLSGLRHRFHSWLTPSQQRGVRILAWASIVSLSGVALTGLWQFFAHRSDPDWYGYEPASEVFISSSFSEGMAALHGLFGASVAVILLVGGGWFAYKVLYDIPWPAVIALVVAMIGLATGSVIRFNLVKLRGREFREAGRGYVQIFGSDLEFVVTGRFELAPLAIRLWTIAHVLTLPILVGVIWLGLTRPDDAGS